MALQSEKIQEFSSGFSKEIDESSKEMILDLVQVSQYQFPVKSTIRELVSNAVDAVKERDVARAILTGAAKETDYFIRRDDPKFKDSNFDSSYYDLKWLSNDPAVKIIYEEGDLGKDRVRIIDNGVGLGGKRLEGSFRLGFSTKRNSRLPLGKFGIGAKAGLSTGVDYYTVITKYNGMEFRFNIYSHKVDSIIPSIDLKTGKTNPYYTFSNGHQAYYLPTKASNGVEVIIESKKFKKQEYLDASKSQLLYFDNVELILKKPTGYEEKIPIKSRIFYEDDTLIVSDNKQYSKPHLIINKVNYGYINWGELELEEKMGNVGVKVSAEEVSINPSRESVVWNEQTKETVLRKFKEAVVIATKLVQDQLQDTDIFKWLKAYLALRNIYSRGDTEDVVSRLAGIVDIQKLNPSFGPDKSLGIGSLWNLFPGMKVEHVHLESKIRGGMAKNKTIRDEVKHTYDMRGDLPIVITKGKIPVQKLQYFLSLNKNGYYLLRYPENADAIVGSDTGGDDSVWILAFDLELLARNIKDKDKEFPLGVQALINLLLDKRKKAIKHIEASSVPIKLEDIKVPDGFTWNESDISDEEDISAALKAASPAERRKLEARVVLYTPRYNNSSSKEKMYNWQKVQPKLVEVQNFVGDDVYYGTNEDSNMIQFIAFLTRPSNTNVRVDISPAYGNKENDTLEAKLTRMGIIESQQYESRFINHWWDTPVILMKVANDNLKDYSMYKHVSEFFLRKVVGTITMSEKLQEWYTAKIIGDYIKDLEFLSSYKVFNAKMASKYQKIWKYYQEHFKDVEGYLGRKYQGIDEAAYEEMLVFQKKVFTFQDFVRHNSKDTEAIAELSMELFGKEYVNGKVIDMEMYDTLMELLEYAEPLKHLFNDLKVLTAKDQILTPELEAEIRSYIKFKGL